MIRRRSACGCRWCRRSTACGGRCCSRAPTVAGGSEARRLVGGAGVDPAGRRHGDRRWRARRDASTVVDLRVYEDDGGWEIVRAGAVAEARGARRRSSGSFTSIPTPTQTRSAADIPVYDELPGRARAGLRAPVHGGCSSWGRGPGRRPRGCSTATRGVSWWGSTRARQMLDVARSRLPLRQVSLRVGALAGSAARRPVRPGGQRALRSPPRRRREARPVRAGRARAARRAGGSCSATWWCRSTRPIDGHSLTPGYDRPSTLAEQLGG